MSFSDGALRACDGDFVRADHFVDCGVFEYYYRITGRKSYVDWHNEQIKPNA